MTLLMVSDVKKWKNISLTLIDAFFYFSLNQFFVKLLIFSCFLSSTIRSWRNDGAERWDIQQRRPFQNISLCLFTHTHTHTHKSLLSIMSVVSRRVQWGIFSCFCPRPCRRWRNDYNVHVRDPVGHSGLQHRRWCAAVWA